jgi:hypothetical protein
VNLFTSFEVIDVSSWYIIKFVTHIALIIDALVSKSSFITVNLYIFFTPTDISTQPTQSTSSDQTDHLVLTYFGKPSLQVQVKRISDIQQHRHDEISPTRRNFTDTTKLHRHDEVSPPQIRTYDNHDTIVPRGKKRHLRRRPPRGKKRQLRRRPSTTSNTKRTTNTKQTTFLEKMTAL